MHLLKVSSYQGIFLADIFATDRPYLTSTEILYLKHGWLWRHVYINQSQLQYQILAQYWIFPRSQEPEIHSDQPSNYLDLMCKHLVLIPLNRVHFQVNFYIKTEPEISVFLLEFKKILPPPSSPPFYPSVSGIVWISVPKSPSRTLASQVTRGEKYQFLSFLGA